MLRREKVQWCTGFFLDIKLLCMRIIFWNIFFFGYFVLLLKKRKEKGFTWSKYWRKTNCIVQCCLLNNYNYQFVVLLLLLFHCICCVTLHCTMSLVFRMPNSCQIEETYYISKIYIDEPSSQRQGGRFYLVCRASNSC